MNGPHSQWLLEPYGAPTSTSEVSSIAGFYCVEALTAFGPPAAALSRSVSEVADEVLRQAGEAIDAIGDFAASAAPESVRPAV